MAFKRVINLSVGQNGTGLLISDLDMDFRIEKSTDLANNTADFTVYNANESTRKNVLKKGNNTLFDIGYEDEAIASMFVGNITQSRSHKTGNTWITKIKASTIISKDKPLETISVSLSYNPGSPLSSPLRALSSLSSLLISGIDNISTIKLTNGWVYAGTFGGALRYIKAILETNKIGMYIDNNEIVIFNIGVASRYKTVLLTYTGGLLAIEDITKAEEKKKRVSFTSLVIPQIRINGIVSFKNTGSNDGTYIVDKFIAQGSNWGNTKYEMKGEATA